MNVSTQQIAVSLLRFALGVNIFIHGVVRLGPNYQKFIDWTTGLFKEAPLPDFAVVAFAHSIPILETLIGILLILGLFTVPALVAGTLLMISLMAGMCLIQNWEIVGIQMIYILIYTALLFVLSNNNNFSIDHYVRK